MRHESEWKHSHLSHSFRWAMIPSLLFFACSIIGVFDSKLEQKEGIIMEEESKEPNMKDKIKKHFRDNREIYIGAGLNVLTGVVSGVVVGSIMNRGRTNVQMCDNELTQITVNGGKRNTNITQQTISIYGNKIGRPGKPVWDMTIGKRFESESLAAEYAGVSKSIMSSHLNGKTDSIMGHKYKFAA